MAYNGAQGTHPLPRPFQTPSDRAAPPGMYGPPGGYGQWAGSPPSGVPPGMGKSPSLPIHSHLTSSTDPDPAGPPGSAMPPGMPQSAHPLPVRPGALPPGFAVPTHMPNINFNDPVIHLSTGLQRDAPAAGRSRQSHAETPGGRRGLGMDRSLDQQRQQVRDFMASSNSAPPTREEIARTIFVGNIPEGVGGDAGIERILQTVGGLRNWTRAVDHNGKRCTFGFAEFEDAQSLRTATEVLKDIVVPSKRPQPKSNQPINGVDKAGAKAGAEMKSPGADKEGTDGDTSAGDADVEVNDEPADEEAEVEKTTLLVRHMLRIVLTELTLPRLLLTRPRSNTLQNGSTRASKAPTNYSFASMVPKMRLPRC
jgi:hypothetical protein